MKRFRGWLLLGPTGSGKTPLGELLEERGLHGRRYVHFDFGQNLRDAAARGEPDEVVSLADVAFVRELLRTGALLEDQDFPLAERILRAFLRRKEVGADTCVVFNGLPRHVNQAEALSRMIAMECVVQLRCTAETVRTRIAANAGGDRALRTDDHAEDIARKLSIYERRTMPLVTYFQQQRVPLIRLDVGNTDRAEDLRQALCTKLRGNSTS